jgi:hypothetical protein
MVLNRARWKRSGPYDADGDQTGETWVGASPSENIAYTSRSLAAIKRFVRCELRLAA